MLAQNFNTSWRIVAVTGLVCTSFLWPAAAQPLTCPMPHEMSGPGMLKETPVQIAKTGSFLASGDSVNRAPEVVANLRKRYPSVSDAELENYLVTAYCPEVGKLNGLSVAEQKARVDRFARQAGVAVYGH